MVELVLDFHGPLASLVGILKGRLVRRYMRLEAECLQAAAVRAALGPAH